MQMTQSLWYGDDILHSLKQSMLSNNSSSSNSTGNSSSEELSVEEQTSALLQAQRYFREAKVTCSVSLRSYTSNKLLKACCDGCIVVAREYTHRVLLAR
jgi:hypothetical protein